MMGGLCNLSPDHIPDSLLRNGPPILLLLEYPLPASSQIHSSGSKYLPCLGVAQCGKQRFRLHSVLEYLCKTEYQFPGVWPETSIAALPQFRFS
jgi:hypothetical protein